MRYLRRLLFILSANIILFPLHSLSVNEFLNKHSTMFGHTGNENATAIRNYLSTYGQGGYWGNVKALVLNSGDLQISYSKIGETFRDEKSDYLSTSITLTVPQVILSAKAGASLDLVGSAHLSTNQYYDEVQFVFATDPTKCNNFQPTNPGYGKISSRLTSEYVEWIAAGSYDSVQICTKNTNNAIHSHLERAFIDLAQLCYQLNYRLNSWFLVRNQSAVDPIESVYRSINDKELSLDDYFSEVLKTPFAIRQNLNQNACTSLEEVKRLLLSEQNLMLNQAGIQINQINGYIYYHYQQVYDVDYHHEISNVDKAPSGAIGELGQLIIKINKPNDKSNFAAILETTAKTLNPNLNDYLIGIQVIRIKSNINKNQGWAILNFGPDQQFLIIDQPQFLFAESTKIANYWNKVDYSLQLHNISYYQQHKTELSYLALANELRVFNDPESSTYSYLRDFKKNLTSQVNK